MATSMFVLTCIAAVVKCSSGKREASASKPHTASTQLNANSKEWFRSKAKFGNRGVPKDVKTMLQDSIPEVSMKSWDSICTDIRQKHKANKESKEIVEPYKKYFLQKHPDASAVAQTLYNHHSRTFGMSTKDALKSSQNICSNMHLAHPRNAFMRAKAVAVKQYLDYGVNKHAFTGSSNANELFLGPSTRQQKMT